MIASFIIGKLVEEMWEFCSDLNKHTNDWRGSWGIQRVWSDDQRRRKHKL